MSTTAPAPTTGTSHAADSGGASSASWPPGGTAAPALTSIRSVELAGGSRHAVARAARRGEQHRVRRGTYLPDHAWRSLDADQRYLLRCLAESEAKGSRPILSHWSAAAVHGIPVIGDWPPTVHRLVERAGGSRSRPAIRAHPARLDTVDVVERNGMLVTSFARTIIDLAAASPFLSAVASADFALHRKRPDRLTKDALFAAFDEAQPVKARARVARVLEFATHLADSPAESASRVNMFLGGFVMPTLQAEYSDAEGFIGAADFEWSGNHLGEVDGRQKYLKPELLRGRTPGEVVYQEKIREDRFRALPKRVTRWDWFRAIDPARLRPFLLAAGVPLRRRGR